MANIFFISLGCDKNRIDAEIMSRRLLDAGHFVTADIAEADCAIVNTCGFIQSAQEEAIECIFDMVREKEAGSVKAVVVTGCLAQRFAVDIRKEIPEVDAVVGLAHNQDIADIVSRAIAGEQLELFGDAKELCIEGERALSTPPHYAFLKIAEGCSNRCTYCAIPAIRGPFRSRPAANILAEAEKLVREGAREIILVAQDTTSYGKDLADGSSLAGLLTELCKIKNLWKVRILYAYPERIDDALIDVIAKEDKIAKYLDIPFQHADAAVLKRMGRFGSKQTLLALIEKLRSRVPDITLRSTFIVGFPGETDAQFEALLDFLREAKLDRAGCFPYSPEEGTPAARLADQLPAEMKNARAERFMQTQSLVMERRLADTIGREVVALCDGFDEERGGFTLRSEADAPDIDTVLCVSLEADLMVGELYTLRITGTDGADLAAEVVL